MLKKILETADNHNVYMASIGSGATKAGAGWAVFGWLVSQEVLALSGVAIALIGLVVNWYYKHQENNRARLEHELRVRELMGESDEQ